MDKTGTMQGIRTLAGYADTKKATGGVVS
jgi:D-alanyl-D-alanine carboxypeptidase